MKNFYRILFILSLTFAVKGCGGGNISNQTGDVLQQPIISTVQSEQLNLKNQNKNIFWAVSNPTLPAGMTNDEFHALNMKFRVEAYEKYDGIWRGIINAPTWQIADQKAKEYLRMTEQHYFSFCIHQEVASSMLRSYFMYTEPSQESVVAMSYYLDILKKYRYYGETNLYIHILPKLKGYWSQEQIQEVAQQCIQRYNQRHGKNLSVESYFLNQVEQQTLNSTAQASLSKQQAAEQLRKDFAKALPAKIEAYKKLSQTKWFRSQDENVIVLSMIILN